MKIYLIKILSRVKLKILTNKKIQMIYFLQNLQKKHHLKILKIILKCNLITNYKETLLIIKNKIIIFILNFKTISHYMTYLIQNIYFKFMINITHKILKLIIVLYKLLMMKMYIYKYLKRVNLLGKLKIMKIYLEIKLIIKCRN